MSGSRSRVVRTGIAGAWHEIFDLVCKGDLKVDDLLYVDPRSPELPHHLTMLAGQAGLSLEVER